MMLGEEDMGEPDGVEDDPLLVRFLMIPDPGDTLKTTGSSLAWIGQGSNSLRPMALDAAFDQSHSLPK